MNTIKFSHDYMKLPSHWEGSYAMLIGCSRVNLEWLKHVAPMFVKRDIEYRGEAGFFDFNFEEGIILTFLHLESNVMFTTIRRYMPEKMDYYQSVLMKVFIMKRI